MPDRYQSDKKIPDTNSWLRDFTRSYDMTSNRVLKRGLGLHKIHSLVTFSSWFRNGYECRWLEGNLMTVWWISITIGFILWEAINDMLLSSLIVKLLEVTRRLVSSVRINDIQSPNSPYQSSAVGPHSISDKTSYREISWSLEAAWLTV